MEGPVTRLRGAVECPNQNRVGDANPGRERLIGQVLIEADLVEVEQLLSHGLLSVRAILHLACSAMQAQNRVPCTSGNLPASVGYGPVGIRTPLPALLKRAVDETGLEKKELAKLLGVSPPWFSRLFNDKAVAGSLGTEGCFKLAAMIGESPQTVLRAAGKPELADAMDEVFGARAARVQPAPLDPLAVGLDEALTHGARRGLAWAAVNLVRESVQLPAIGSAPERKRGGQR